MPVSLPRTTTHRPKPFSREVRAKLHPNGEFSIYLQRKTKPKPPIRPRGVNTESLFFFLNHAFGTSLGAAVAWVNAMGLSHVTNSDKELAAAAVEGGRGTKTVKRYGLRGITTYGARRVRCGCHLLQKRYHRSRLVFATCTVPDLPIEQMKLLHERWGVVVETYRRKITRALRDNHLPGELVSVSEIQEKRYERSGVPVLHLHSVYCGKRGGRNWAIDIETHDQFWKDSVCSVLGDYSIDFAKACRLETVRKNAERYLGKYMSKGAKVVGLLAKNGFSGWVPKQWWGISRSLGAAIDQETRDISDFAEWLNDAANGERTDLVMWHRDIFLECEGGEKIRIARFGRLSPKLTTDIQQNYNRKQQILNIS